MITWEGSKGVGDVDIRGKGIPSRRNRKCKVPEAGLWAVCSSYSVGERETQTSAP